MKSIKGKITMMAVVISTLCMLMLSVICYYNAKQSITEETLSKIRNQSNTYAATIDGWLEMQGEIIKEVGGDVEASKPTDKQGLEAYFNRETEANAEFAALYVGYADKTLIGDSNSMSLTPEGYDPTTREWYKQAVSQGKLIYTAPYKDLFSGKMVITIAVPVKSGGEIIGVAGADIFAEYLMNLTSEAKSGEGSYGFLLDAGKNFVVHENPEFKPNEAGSFNLGTVLDGRFAAVYDKLDGNNNTVTTVQDYDGISKYYVTSKIKTTDWTFGFAVPESQVMQPLRSLQSQFTLYIGLSIIIMIVLLIWLLGRTFRPLNIMIGKVERISKGDFTRDEKQESHYSNDELGHLSMSIDNMQEDLRTFMVGLMGSAQNLSASAEELSATVEELTSKAISIKESVDEIADGVQDSSAASQEISASIEEVDSSINELSQKALEVKEKSDKAIDATRKIYDEKKQKMMKAIEDGKVVENIKVMADAIANIADQTNLLALNAAIEAARAGEHGRGFAVVAEEVRKLAEQSSQAVSSIQETITQVQSAFRSSIDTSSDILHFINNDVNKQFDAYSTTGRQYYSDSDFVSKMSDEIAAMSEEIAATVEQVNGAIQNLSESAQVSNEKTESIKENIDETTKAIEQVAYTAQDQAEMAQLLNEMVQKFKI